MIEKYDIHYFCYSKTQNSNNKNMKWASTIMMRRENRKKKKTLKAHRNFDYDITNIIEKF
jgi:hypothetical protein